MRKTPEGKRDDTITRLASKAGVMIRDGLVHEKADRVAERLIEAAIASGRDERKMRDTVPRQIEEGKMLDVPRISKESRVKGTEAGYFILKSANSGHRYEEQISNFTADILNDVIRDNGQEQTQHLEVEVQIAGARRAILVPSRDFAKMDWLADLGRIGAHRPIIWAGQGNKDNVRMQIQLASDTAGRTGTRRIYTHTGWTKHEGKQVYLHGGGAIGADNVVVELYEPLKSFVLPPVPTGDALKEACQAALGLLDLADERITAPMFCAPFAALFGHGVSPWYFGESGIFKSQLLCLQQQFFGAGFRARYNEKNLPGSWRNINSAVGLEEVGFQCKDAIFGIDDYKPDGAQPEIEKLNRFVSALISSSVDRNVRLRGKPIPGGSVGLQAVKPVRGMIVSTGEMKNAGRSVRARTWIVQVNEGDVTKEKLTIAQGHANTGHYASATAAIINWIRPRLDEIKVNYEQDRTLIQAGGIHNRTADNVAELFRGAHYALKAMTELGVITQDEADGYRKRIERGLLANVPEQDRANREENPVENLIAGIARGLLAGKFHITTPNGNMPHTAANQLGWLARRMEDGKFTIGGPTGEARGDRVGVYRADRNAIIFEIDALYRAAISMGAKIDCGATDLPDRLSKAGYLAYQDGRHAMIKAAPSWQRRFVALRRTCSSAKRGPPGLRNCLKWRQGISKQTI
jgi:hypothetical protein